MGTVHEAVRLTDGKVFALKLLQGPSGPTALTRFALEAETALRVQSPHVVSICDFGTTSEGQLFLVLEYVLGATLAEEENRFGDRGWALRILCQIAKGLEAIHKAGVVHRDVKPSNILLSYESDPLYPTAKITDFGVSALGPSDESPDATVIEKTMTRTGSLVGTPAYMAPEAYDGSHELDAKSDVFSFAIVAREILGSPSSGPEALPIGLRLTAPGDLTHETQFQGALDPETNAVLTSCLAKDPQRRPSAEAIRIALEKSLHGFQTGAWSVGGTAA
jgi:serine/threonine-protein kinase